MRVSSSSSSGVEPATMPPPANNRVFPPSSSAHRKRDPPLAVAMCIDPSDRARIACSAHALEAPNHVPLPCRAATRTRPRWDAARPRSRARCEPRACAPWISVARCCTLASLSRRRTRRDGQRLAELRQQLLDRAQGNVVLHRVLGRVPKAPAELFVLCLVGPSPNGSGEHIGAHVLASGAHEQLRGSPDQAVDRERSSTPETSRRVA